MYGKDQVSKVHATRANELAFSAEHAFHDFFFQMVDFSPLKEGQNLPDVEIRELPGRTGGSTASASHTETDRRFDFIDDPRYFPVIRIVINLPVVTDPITKRFHLVLF